MLLLSLSGSSVIKAFIQNEIKLSKIAVVQTILKYKENNLIDNMTLVLYNLNFCVVGFNLLKN